MEATPGSFGARLPGDAPWWRVAVNAPYLTASAALPSSNSNEMVKYFNATPTQQKRELKREKKNNNKKTAKSLVTHEIQISFRYFRSRRNGLAQKGQSSLDSLRRHRPNANEKTKNLVLCVVMEMPRQWISLFTNSLVNNLFFFSQPILIRMRGLFARVIINIPS